MQVSDASPLRLTYALLRPETAPAAIAALTPPRDAAAVEGLAAVVHAGPTARLAAVALQALLGSDSPLVTDALGGALDSPHASVRVNAALALRDRRCGRFTGRLAELLRADPSWLVRRAALRALAAGPDEASRRAVLIAHDDPHWRVRHALIHALLDRGGQVDLSAGIARARGRTSENLRLDGLQKYLNFRATGRPPRDEEIPAPPDPGAACPVWDWDPAVMVRTLERLGEGGRADAVALMPHLMGHEDERVRALAVDTLRTSGTARELAESLRHLAEPRGDACTSLRGLLSALDLDRREETATLVLQLPDPGPHQLAWAIDQAEAAFPADEVAGCLNALFAEDQHPVVRAALAALTARWHCQSRAERLQRFLRDPDPAVRLAALRGLNAGEDLTAPAEALAPLLADPSPETRAEAVRGLLRQGHVTGELLALADDPEPPVRIALAEGLVELSPAPAAAVIARLQADYHPFVRAAALTPERAAQLVADPEQETSWHVLAEAAKLGETPLWHIEPEHPWRPPAATPAVAPEFRPQPAAPPNARLFGPQKLLVPPVGISGAYGLPAEGFARAVEAGVNLFFWEPNYLTLMDFMAGLPAGQRNGLHVIAGTFEADGKRIRRDVERALRMLRRDTIDVFMLFWVRSWNRTADEVRTTLDALKRDGKLGAYGLSTHMRPLAVEALRAGWNPVMVRHSAAHRGAEQHVFPTALELGTSIITFNNTCYGRLLKPNPGVTPPTAADCYRYTLSQPAVTICLSAPATFEHLEENLSVIRDLDLPDDRRRELLENGDLVYREDTTFRKLVRVL